MPRTSDPYLTEQLRQLETLIAAHPAHPETRHARRLVRRVRTYQMRGLLPRTRRYVLGDIWTAVRVLEANEPRGRDPPP